MSGEPDWIDALRAECLRTSQNKTADKIGYSGAAISTVLKGKYRGNLKRIEQAVRGALMNGKIACPALGEIPANECVQHLRNAARWQGTNTMRAKMYRACRACPRFTKED